jgi:hypothetical protein
VVEGDSKRKKAYDLSLMKQKKRVKIALNFASPEKDFFIYL